MVDSARPSAILLGKSWVTSSNDAMTPEELRDARAYAWGYFALHADQRMKLFNFFLILAGLILGAFPAVRSIGADTKFAALLPLLLTLAAFTFWRLEERTRGLVKGGEDALRFLDEQWPVNPLWSDGAPHVLRLIERDDYLTDRIKQRWTVKRLRLMPISYADSFRLVYLMMAGVGLVLAAWVLLR